MALLDPAAVVRADAAAPDGMEVVRGAAAVAERVLEAGGFSRLARIARPALVNGAAGLVMIAEGRPITVMAFTVRQGLVVEIDILADPERLSRLDLTVLNG